MNIETLAQVVTNRTGSPTKIRDDELIVKVCNSCGNNKWNLQLNSTKGVYRCWVCSTSGTITGFLQKIGHGGTFIPERSHKEIAQKHTTYDFSPAHSYPRAVTYLENRGLTLADIRHYEMGFAVTGRWANRVVFPLRDYFTSEIVGYQGRTIVNKDPKYLLSGKVPSVVGYRNNTSTHIICEGAFDSITAHKAGYNSAFLVGLGNIDERWRGWASRVILEHSDAKIVILLDPGTDADSHKLKQHISQITPCSVVLLPGPEDAGELSPTELKRIIEDETK